MVPTGFEKNRNSRKLCDIVPNAVDENSIEVSKVYA